MTRLLLDTTILIDAERNVAALDRLIEDDDDIAISAVTIAELRVGALLADRRRASARNAFVDEVAESIPILAYDVEVAEAHAELLAAMRTNGRPRGAHDLIVAATAKAFARTVLSADRAAFRDLPGVSVRSSR